MSLIRGAQRTRRRNVVTCSYTGIVGGRIRDAPSTTIRTRGRGVKQICRWQASLIFVGLLMLSRDGSYKNMGLSRYRVSQGTWS